MKYSLQVSRKCRINRSLENKFLEVDKKNLKIMVGESF